MHITSSGRVTRFRRAACAAIAIALSSCAAAGIRYYVEPSAGPLAFLNVTDREGNIVQVFAYAESKDCVGRYYLQDETDDRRSVLTSFAKIPAGKPISIGLFLNPRYEKYCAINAMFEPEAGRYYRVSMSEDDVSCHMVLTSSQDERFENPRREGFTVMGPSVRERWDENSSFCNSADARSVSPDGGAADLRR